MVGTMDLFNENVQKGIINVLSAFFHREEPFNKEEVNQLFELDIVYIVDEFLYVKCGQRDYCLGNPLLKMEVPDAQY